METIIVKNQLVIIYNKKTCNLINHIGFSLIIPYKALEILNRLKICNSAILELLQQIPNRDYPHGIK